MELEETLTACREGFRVRRVDHDRTGQWIDAEGVLRHRSGGFFNVVGVEFGPASLGGASSQAVFLYQPQAAVTGLLTAVIGGRRHYLLQGRAEPGCLAMAQFGPTVQSTPANYLRQHGGAATPYIECFLAAGSGITVLQDTTQSDLGERYLMKCKRSILVECPPDIPVAAPFVWASGAALREAIRRSAFLNIDLRSLLAIAPWDGDLAPASRPLRDSLAQPVRAEVLGGLVAPLAGPAAMWRPLRLDRLSNWRQAGQEWEEIEPDQGFGIHFFETVGARQREVASWVQPLVDSTTEGHAILACRDGASGFEVLVRVTRERGLAHGCGVGPSFLRYPGRPAAGAVAGEILLSTVESDEGGRFYQDASRYELVLAADQSDDQGPNAFWINLAELKTLLALSNVCTIQLRALAASLLGA